MILVTGATGTNGVELLNQLSASGEPARALVRNPEKAEKALPPDVQLVRGDLDNPGALDAAMEEIEKVFLLAPVDARQVELEKNVIDAAVRAGVKHLVKFSAIHSAADSHSRLLRAHFQTEQNIRAAAIPFTFLRPNVFMQELLRQGPSIASQGEFYLPFPPSVRLSFVDVRDIAAVVVKALTEPGHEGKTHTITGSAALHLDEIASHFSTALGKPVRYVGLTMEQFRQGFAASGAPGWTVDAVCELYETFVPANSVVTDIIQQITGKPARPLADFARDHAAVFAKG
jgi:uncharacterized protein YbjT (DUF2867 family)